MSSGALAGSESGVEIEGIPPELLEGTSVEEQRRALEQFQAQPSAEERVNQGQPRNQASRDDAHGLRHLQQGLSDRAQQLQGWETVSSPAARISASQTGSQVRSRGISSTRDGRPLVPTTTRGNRARQARGRVQDSPQNMEESVDEEFMHILRGIMQSQVHPGNLRQDQSRISQSFQQLMMQHSEVRSRSQGVSQRQIDNYTMRYTMQHVSQTESNCPVCLVEYEAQDDCRRLPCLHVFHCECIDPWLHENDSCPVCKSGIMSAASSTADLLEPTSSQSVGSGAPSSGNARSQRRRNRGSSSNNVRDGSVDGGARSVSIHDRIGAVIRPRSSQASSSSARSRSQPGQEASTVAESNSTPDTLHRIQHSLSNFARQVRVPRLRSRTASSSSESEPVEIERSSLRSHSVHGENMEEASQDASHAYSAGSNLEVEDVGAAGQSTHEARENHTNSAADRLTESPSDENFRDFHLVDHASSNNEHTGGQNSNSPGLSRLSRSFRRIGSLFTRGSDSPGTSSYKRL